MSEKYMFFNSTENDEREYSEADMADLISGICGDGVLEGLEVSRGNNGLLITPGKAIVCGHCYVLDEEIELEAEVLEYMHIDRVVIRLDRVQRNIHIILKTGTEEEAATVIQNSEIYEIPIALVTVQANVRVITGLESEAEYVRDYKRIVGSPIYYGESAPSRRIGKEGDIYVQYKE